MMNENYNIDLLGKRLKHLRILRGKTQREIAEVLYVSTDSIAGYENGRIRLGHDYIATLCEYFNVSADYFYFGLSKPFSAPKQQEMEAILLLLDEKSKPDIKRAYAILKLVFQK